jgi:GTP cyclohydrolase I
MVAPEHPNAEIPQAPLSPRGLVEQWFNAVVTWLGDDPNREGLLQTPDRIIRSYDKLYGGYLMKPELILHRTFANDTNQMVILRDIEFYSTCEHHMLPFFGRAHIAYIPSERVVGISKLARLLECYSRRLQIQERLTEQIAEAIQEHLDPLGTAVLLEAQHLCMIARGVEKQNSIMITSALRGAFLEDDRTREEFLSCARRP